MTPLEKAADALRRHEQAGRKLNEWNIVSPGQRKRWLAKAELVLTSYTIACDIGLFEEAQRAKDKAA